MNQHTGHPVTFREVDGVNQHAGSRASFRAVNGVNHHPFGLSLSKPSTRSPTTGPGRTVTRHG